MDLRTRKASWGEEDCADADVVDRTSSLSLLAFDSAAKSVAASVEAIRTQTIHHPRLVFEVRSISRGRARVSMYVPISWWWILMHSIRGQGCCMLVVSGVAVGAARSGMLGIEERMVRLVGS